MAGGSNIKAAPDALTPVKVEQLLDWMDARHALPLVIGVDMASGEDVHASALILDGRVVAVVSEGGAV